MSNLHASRESEYLEDRVSQKAIQTTGVVDIERKLSQHQNGLTFKVGTKEFSFVRILSPNGSRT